MRPTLLALLLVLLATAPSRPAGAAIDLRRVDTSLVGLPFGGDADAVAGWVKERLERLYAPRLKSAVDDNERAKLRAQLDREVFDFRSRLVAFDGRRTGFEVSAIAGEFMAGTDEGLLVHKDAEGDHYFFLIGGKFWKYGRMLPADGPFADRIAAQAKRVGKPESVDSTRDGSGEPAPVRATWSDERLRVRLWNRRLLYGYDLLLVDFRPLADGIEGLRGGRTADGDGPSLEPDLESYLLGEGEDEEAKLRDEAQRRRDKDPAPPPPRR